MTTKKQDDAFIDAIVSSSLLEDAISWINDNLSPEDVFDNDILKIWADHNYEI